MGDPYDGLPPPLRLKKPEKYREKTKIKQIPLMKANEGSLDGMIQVLEELDTLLLDKFKSLQNPSNESVNSFTSLENIFVFIFGDQLTLKMISSAQASKLEGRKHVPHRDFSWYLKGIGDFHLRWTYLQAIFSDHFDYDGNKVANIGQFTYV